MQDIWQVFKVKRSRNALTKNDCLINFKLGGNYPHNTLLTFYDLSSNKKCCRFFWLYNKKTTENVLQLLKYPSLIENQGLSNLTIVSEF